MPPNNFSAMSYSITVLFLITSAYHSPEIFDGALLRFVIHADDAEAFGKAVSPLKVIEQRPDEVTAHIHTILHGEAGLDEMIFQIIESACGREFFHRR